MNERHFKMVKSINKFIYYFNRLSGLLPYTFDENTKCYVKSINLQIYAITQTLAIIMCSCLAWFYYHNNKSILLHIEDYSKFINIICTHWISLIILYQKIFQNSHLLDIMNQSNKIYYNPKIYNPTNHVRVVNGIFYVMLVFYTVLPLISLSFDLMSVRAPTLMDMSVITGLKIVDIWLTSSFIPVLSFFWIIQNMLTSLRKRLTEVLIESDGYDKDRVLENLNLEQLQHEFNDISIIYSKIVELINSLLKYFSNIILYHILICYTNFVWHIFKFIQNVIILIISDSSVDTSITLIGCGTSVMRVFYIFSLLSIIIAASDMVVTKHEKLLLDLYNCQETFRNDCLDESVRIFLKLFN